MKYISLIIILTVTLHKLYLFAISKEFKLELDQIVNDFYISTANTEMIDIIYKVPLATTTIDDYSIPNMKS